MSNRTALLATGRLPLSVGIAAVISMAACTVKVGAVGLKGPAQSAGAVAATAVKDLARVATNNLQPKLDHFGDALPTGVIVRLGTTRLRQKVSGSRAIRFSPEGRELVTVGGDGWIRFWESSSGKELRSIASKEDKRSRESILSPEGKLLAIVEEKAIRLLESTTGRMVCTISCEIEHRSRTAVAFAPDGSSLAATLIDGSIKVYETATGKELQSIDAGGSRNNPLFFAHGGKHLVSIQSDSLQAPLVTWDLATGKVIQTTYLQKSNSGSLSLSAFSPDAELVAGVEYSVGESRGNSGQTTRSLYYSLIVLDAKTGRELLPTDAESDRIQEVAFAPDGKSVAFGGAGHRITVWDIASGKRRIQLTSYADGSLGRELRALAFSPNGQKLAAAGSGAAIEIWDLVKGSAVNESAAGHHSELSVLCYSLDGKRLATASFDRTIRVWDVATGTQQLVLKGHTAFLVALAYSSDGQSLASADADNTLMVWNSVTGQKLLEMQAETLKASNRIQNCTIAFTPDGKRLVSWAGNNGPVCCWELEWGRQLYAREVLLPIVPTDIRMPVEASNRISLDWYDRLYARLSSDSRLLALHLPKATHIVDTATGQELMRFRQESVLTISDEGRIIACDGDGTIRLVDRATGQELSKLSIPQWRGRFALAPDGRTIATANYPKGISLYETRGGKLLSEIPLANVWVTALAYSPDGKTLASGQSDSTALVWDLTPGLRQLGDSEEKPAEADLEACWADLTNADAKKARAAVTTLARSPNTAVPFLKRRLRPVEHTSQEKIKSLLDDLESNDAAVWQKAGRTLSLLGTEAEPAMRLALRCEYTAPAKRRIESLLKTPANRGLPTGETLRVLRAIHALELIGSREAAKILADLASGAPSAPETLEAQTAGARLAARR